MNNPEFAAVLALITLLADPTAAKAKLTELQAAIAACDARKAEADAAHDRLETERERLVKLEASLREREVAVFESERRHESTLEEIRKWTREHAPNRLITVGPGGLTREPDNTPIAPADPINDRYAEPMGKPVAIQASQTRKTRARA
jgi:hypothetical protein